jgi:hypothetical protein
MRLLTTFSDSGVAEGLLDDADVDALRSRGLRRVSRAPACLRVASRCPPVLGASDRAVEVRLRSATCLDGNAGRRC